MNILILTTIGGFVPQFEMNDVKLLLRNGCSVHYASNFDYPVYEMDKQQLSEMGILMHPVCIRKSPAALRANLRALRQVITLIRKHDIKILHCHNPMGGVIGRLAAHLSGRDVKVIYTAHGFHFYKGAPLLNWLLYFPVESFLARFTDRIITINREDYRRARHMHLKEKGKTEIIHSVGLDFVKFRPRPEMREEMRQRLQVPEGNFHIVMAAELNENKNQKAIIEALHLLGRKNITLTLCGRGPALQELTGLVEKYGLTDQVRFAGFLPHMEEVLQSADCFTFPSYREGLGMAAVEALACGVPVIAADNRGTREYMKHLVNGIVCSAKNPKAFAAAISRLQDDPDFRHELARAARESISEFNITETEKTMRRIYSQVTGRQMV